MDKKVCKECNIEKPVSEFSRNKGCKDGYLPLCKICRNKKLLESNKNYRDANKDKIAKSNKEWAIKNAEYLKEKRKIYYNQNKDDILLRVKIYRSDNRDKILACGKKFRDNNKELVSKRRKEHKIKHRDRVLEQKREYYAKNKETVKKWFTDNEDILREKRKAKYEENKPEIFEKIYQRKRTDPLYKLKFTLRIRIYGALKRKGWTKNSSNIKLLGASYETVKSYIENQFTEGMSWDNHGKWHIDHIIPLSKAETEEEIVSLFNYKNLQPLWALENFKKNDSLTWKKAI